MSLPQLGKRLHDQALVDRSEEGQLILQEQLADRRQPKEEFEEDGAVPLRNGWPKDLYEPLEQARRWHECPSSRLFRRPGRLFHLFEASRPNKNSQLAFKRARLLWSALSAAKRIREIAIEAFRQGLLVRWFEYRPQKPGGGYDQLKPLNAHEIAPVRRIKDRKLLWALALSVSNKESLVFWSPGSQVQPGVLFTADSDLARIRMPFPCELKGAIVTAPHHGSEANRNAYRVAQKAAVENASSLFWVRSDGRYGKRPGQPFKIVSGRRVCTICNLGGHFVSNQTVELVAGSGSWAPVNTRLCSCV